MLTTQRFFILFHNVHTHTTMSSVWFDRREVSELGKRTKEREHKKKVVGGTSWLEATP